MVSDGAAAVWCALQGRHVLLMHSQAWQKGCPASVCELLRTCREAALKAARCWLPEESGAAPEPGAAAAAAASMRACRAARSRLRVPSARPTGLGCQLGCVCSSVLCAGSACGAKRGRLQSRGHVGFALNAVSGMVRQCMPALELMRSVHGLHTCSGGSACSSSMTMALSGSEPSGVAEACCSWSCVSASKCPVYSQLNVKDWPCAGVDKRQVFLAMTQQRYGRTRCSIKPISSSVCRIHGADHPAAHLRLVCMLQAEQC